MNNLVNKVTLIGNLGANPEVRTTAGGKQLALMSLATTENFIKQDGTRKSETQWHNCVAWGNLATIAEKYLVKGKQVAVEGKLVHRSYEDGKGDKRYITEVVLTDLVMVGQKS